MITRDLVITTIDFMFVYIVAKIALAQHNILFASICAFILLILIWRFFRRSEK